MISKPQTIKDYNNWLFKTFGYKNDLSDKRGYELLVKQLSNKIVKSDFWSFFISQVQEIERQYHILTGISIFKHPYKIQLLTKPFNSVLNKSYRINVLHNTEWEQPPQKQGWILPTNWVYNIDDIFRTTLIVNYIDGVLYIINSLEKIFNESKIEYYKHYDASDSSYYGAHFYVKVPHKAFDGVEHDFCIEVKILTTLQEYISSLTHNFYVKNRETPKSEMPWKWEPNSLDFQLNELGHTAQFLDALILRIRDNSK